MREEFNSLSKFLRWSLMIFIIKGFRYIIFIFIVISTRVWQICPPAFLRCLSNPGTDTELRTTSFIESKGVEPSNSVSVLSWFSKLLRRLSSGGCRFNPDYGRVTVQEYLTLVSGYGLRNQSSDPCGFNKVRISKFRVDSRVRQTPEYRPKRCANNHKEKTLNDKNLIPSSIFL